MQKLENSSLVAKLYISKDGYQSKIWLREKFNNHAFFTYLKRMRALDGTCQTVCLNIKIFVASGCLIQSIILRYLVFVVEPSLCIMAEKHITLMLLFWNNCISSPILILPQQDLKLDISLKLALECSSLVRGLYGHAFLSASTMQSVSND